MSGGSSEERELDILRLALAEDESPVEFLRSVLAAVPAFITRVDSNYVIRFINMVVPSLAVETVIGVNVFEFIAPEHHERARACFEKVQREREPDRYEAVATGADGSSAHYVNYVSPIHDTDGSIGLCIVGIDLTAERQRQQHLEASQEKLKLAVEATGMGMWDWDMVTDVVSWDERMLEITGRNQGVGVEGFAAEVVHPDDRDTVLANYQGALASGRLRDAPARIMRPDGSVRHTLTSGIARRDADGNVVRFTGGMLDVTDQRTMEAQLRRAQKSEAIGNLAAGIAHNFNNMLMVLMPGLELMREVLPASHRQLGDDAAVAVERAAQLVRQLMTYAGQSSRGATRRLAPAPVVQQTVDICRSTFPRHIELVVTDHGVPDVLCEDGDLRQVLLNILINAKDALHEAPPERPRISVEVRRPTVVAPEVPRGDYVAVAIRDNGPGMTQQVQSQIFEPFFTTKATAGTGLGLATSLAMLREHGGWIGCASEPGAGAVFTLYLPVA